MRRLLLVAGTLAAVAAGPATVAAAQVTVSGASPFAACTADDVAGQPGTNVRDSEVEPWVDVNPKNPMNVVGGFQQDRWSNGGARGLVAGVSFDGGASWLEVVIPKITLCSGGTAAGGGDFTRATDPWLSFAPNGELYFFSLSLDIETPVGREGGFGKNAMLVSKSIDGGLTWSDPITIARDEAPRFLNDKNAITADPTDDRFVYAVWDRLQLPVGAVINPENVFGLGFKGPATFSRTTDGGATWEAPRKIYDPAGNNQTIGNQIVVGQDGALYDFFNEILNFRNDDGGAQFEFNVAFVTSRDRGATWSRGPAARVAKLLSVGVRDPDTGDPVRTGDIIPEPAVDRRGGNLYVVWQDGRFSGFAHDDVALSMSKDGGRTWSAPVKVNRTPVPASAFTPAIKVADDGTIGIFYYDFRNNTPDGATLPTDAFLARYRLDGGGLVLVDETRLTGASFDMRRAPVARGFFLGDYSGLGVAGNAFLPFFSVTTPTDPANVVFTRIGP